MARLYLEMHGWATIQEWKDCSSLALTFVLASSNGLRWSWGKILSSSLYLPAKVSPPVRLHPAPFKRYRNGYDQAYIKRHCTCLKRDIFGSSCKCDSAPPAEAQYIKIAKNTQEWMHIPQKPVILRTPLLPTSLQKWAQHLILAIGLYYFLSNICKPQLQKRDDDKSG